MVAKREAEGSRFQFKELTDREFEQQLRLKLYEEADEVVRATTQHELIEELADVLEVIDALCKINGLTKEEIITAQAKKRGLRGSFDGRKFVETVEHPEGSPAENYCLTQPKKYPEIKD